jgi:hypothetical protein
LDVVKTGLDGITAAFLVANEIFHLVVLLYKIAIVFILDGLDSDLSLGESFTQQHKLFFSFF